MRKTRAKTPEGVLRAAARYIEEHGWHQGSPKAEDGSVCAYWAIRSVTDYDLAEGAADLADERTGDISGFASLISFNDNPKTTKEMVLAVLRG